MTPAYPFTLVCPLCRAALQAGRPQSLLCPSCGTPYAIEDGIPDLTLGDRFDDEQNADLFSYEEETCRFTTQNYILPLLRQLSSASRAPLRVLSLGCGLGTDIDVLAQEGFEVAGIDCGNRTSQWQQRSHKNRLYLANGKHLPFNSHEFDVVYCGCVFPHIGVEGDSNRIAADGRQQRMAVAREMVRVAKPDGRLFVSSPNRRFPFDLFHGRAPGGRALPRFNPPGNPFLLSAGDYRSMFQQAGFSRGDMLPVENYWGFIRRRKSLLGQLTAWPVKTLFRVSSRPWAQPVRNSPLVPWICMLFRKEA